MGEPQMSDTPPTSGQPREFEERFASLPRWRRPRRLRRQLALALVTTAAVAVATFGAVNFVGARDLLVRGTEDQLVAVGATRADSVAAGEDRLIAEISVAASDRAIAGVLVDFDREFAALEERTLTPDQQAELVAYYTERVVQPLNDAGLGPLTADDLLPSTAAGRWLQYHYVIRPPGEPPPADAGDGSGYSEVNAAITDTVRAFSDARGGGDVLLIDVRGTVVYSLDKSNDVGTSLVTGPYADGALAEAVTVSLPRTRVGGTVLTDFSVSASGQPSLYAVSPLSDGTTVVGGLAVAIPAEALNDIVSSSGEWDAIGLADGDSYIVDSNGLLQSEPRAWIEDPDGYLDRLRAGDEEGQGEAELIDLLGSPVGIQKIDTAPVRAAVDGQEFRGTARDYFGDSTFAASQSFSASGRQWVVVTQVPRSVVLDPLTQYLRQILVVLAIVLPIVAGLGVWLSRLLTRPIRPTVDAADAIAHGERDPDLDTARRDEFGDLARRLSAMSTALGAHEAELTAEFERKRQLLLAVLPPKLVDQDGNIAGSGEQSMHATVVAVTLAPSEEHEEPELLGQALQRAAELAEVAADETGVQRVRVAADRYLFIAGASSGDSGADAALEFVEQFWRKVNIDGGDIDLDLHVGLSSGPVATGVFDSGSLTFGAWGEPVRRALALASMSRAHAVLIDATTASILSGYEGRMQPAHDVVDLDDDPMELYTLDLLADRADR